MCPDVAAEPALQHGQRRTRQHHPEPDEPVVDARDALVAGDLGFRRQHEHLGEGEAADASADDNDLQHCQSIPCSSGEPHTTNRWISTLLTIGT